MAEIESDAAVTMVCADGGDLLKELNFKHKMWPWGLTSLAVGVAAAALWVMTSHSLLVVLAAAGLVLSVPFWVWDNRRMTTVLFYEVEQPVLSALENLHAAFDRIAACHCVWVVDASGHTSDWKRNAGAGTLIRRKSVRPRECSPPFLKTNISVPCLPAGKQRLFFLPDRLLILDSSGYGAVSYSELRCNVSPSRFIETGGVPSDARVVDQTWRYVNKGGGPDRRFSNNRQIPIVIYDALTLDSDTGLNEHFQLSSEGSGFDLTIAISRMVEALKASAGTAPSPQLVIEPSPNEPIDRDLGGEPSFYIFMNGVQGPFSKPELESKLACGEIALNTLSCIAGTENWTPLEVFLKRG